MNRYHKEKLDKIEKETDQNPHYSKQQSSEYSGHHHVYYPLNNAQKRSIVKDWIKKHPGLSLNEFLNLLNSLNCC